MKKTTKPILTLHFVLLVTFFVTVGTSSVLAGHYELEDIPFLQDGELAKFSSAGVTSTERLLSQIAKRQDRRTLAGKTGIADERLAELANKVDLLRVNGIGPKMVAMLQAAGVVNLKALIAQDADALHKRMVQVNDELHIGQVVPMTGVLAGWIAQAKTLPPLLQE